MEKFIEDIIRTCKKKYNNEPLFHDIGDIVPFINYFDESSDFSYNQINLTVNKIRENWLYQRNSKYIYLADQIDLILGFIEFYRQVNDKKILEYCKNVINSILKHFIKDSMIFGRYSTAKCQLESGKTYYGAMIIEFLVDLYEFTYDRKYLNIAYKLSQKIISNFYFKRYSIPGDWNNLKFLFRNFRNNIWNMNISKSNNFIIGLISVYEKTHDELLLNSIENYFLKMNKYLFIDNILYSKVNIKNGKKEKPNLISSFEAIDRLCYASYITKNEYYLDFAKKIALPWIDNQPKSGVFPYWFRDNISWLDSDVDFCISLLRIYELSNEKKFKLSADKCYNGLVKYNLPYSSINVHTNKKVENLNYGTIHDPDLYLADAKYLALFLKLPIYYSHAKNIYGDNGIFKLLRDR